MSNQVASQLNAGRVHPSRVDGSAAHFNRRTLLGGAAAALFTNMSVGLMANEASARAGSAKVPNRAASPQRANTAPPPPAFKIERVSTHVYAAQALHTPVVNGNSMLIVTREGLVVVDAQSHASAARALYEQFSREVTALPVRYLINSHHHFDHAHGNAAYKALFGNQLEIISTHFARAALEQAGRWFNGFLLGQPVPSTQLESVPNQAGYYDFLAGLVGSLREQIPILEAQLARDIRGSKQAKLEALRSFFREVTPFTPALPTLTFERGLSLHCGDVVIEVLNFGRAHTAGDAIVFVPQDRVVFSGDLVHGLEPLLFEAYPDEWPGALEQLGKLKFDTLIGGHGPVQRGKANLTLFKAYLTELNQLVSAAVAAGKSLPALKQELKAERFRSLQGNAFRQYVQQNRSELLALPRSQPFDPIVAYAVEQVYRYYQKR